MKPVLPRTHTRLRGGHPPEGLGLQLKGLAVREGERFSDYLDAIIGSIKGLELKEDAMRSLAGRFRRLVEHLEEYANKVACSKAI